MKTIIDAAKEYSLARNNSNEIQILYDYEAFKQGVEFAQRWIPVEEELPDQKYEDGETEQVLLKHPNGFISTGIYDHSVKGWYNDIANRGFMNVSHWRPIERH